LKSQINQIKSDISCKLNSTHHKSENIEYANYNQKGKINCVNDNDSNSHMLVNILDKINTIENNMDQSVFRCSNSYSN